MDLLQPSFMITAIICWGLLVGLGLHQLHHEAPKHRSANKLKEAVLIQLLGLTAGAGLVMGLVSGTTIAGHGISVSIDGVAVVIAVAGYVLAAAFVLAWPTHRKAGAALVQEFEVGTTQSAGRIHILATSVALPLVMTPGLASHAGPSDELAALLRQVKPWYLAGWYDRERGTIGLAHKNVVIEIDRDRVAGLQIVLLRRAKGPGFVSLEAVLADGPGRITLISSDRYREEAHDWLTRTTPALEALFHVKIAVVDAGQDC